MIQCTLLGCVGVIKGHDVSVPFFADWKNHSWWGAAGNEKAWWAEMLNPTLKPIAYGWNSLIWVTTPFCSLDHQPLQSQMIFIQIKNQRAVEGLVYGTVSKSLSRLDEKGKVLRQGQNPSPEPFGFNFKDRHYSIYSSNSLKSIPSTALSVSLALEAIYLLFFFKLKRVLVVTLLLIFNTAVALVVKAV